MTGRGRILDQCTYLFICYKRLLCPRPFHFVIAKVIHYKTKHCVGSYHAMVFTIVRLAFLSVSEIDQFFKFFRVGV